MLKLILDLQKKGYIISFQLPVMWTWSSGVNLIITTFFLTRRLQFLCILVFWNISNYNLVLVYLKIAVCRARSWTNAGRVCPASGSNREAAWRALSPAATALWSRNFSSGPFENSKKDSVFLVFHGYVHDCRKVKKNWGGWVSWWSVSESNGPLRRPIVDN